MRNKLFNRLDLRHLAKLIAIASFLTVGDGGSICASASTTVQDAPLVPCAVPTALAPVWGKLVVSGNTVTCYYGTGLTTPKSWTQLGTPQTINFINNPILVGLFLTSDSSSVLGSGTIDNFSITPAPTYRLADYDIGQPSVMGSANLLDGVWNITGGGSGVLGTYDQCNFQSWLVWGDCTVICRTTSFASTYYNQKMGIMVRDGFNSGSDCALFCVKKTGSVDYQYRTTFKNNADVTQFVAPPAPGTGSSVAVGLGLTGGTSYTLRP
jgi:hypothetical protein